MATTLAMNAREWQQAASSTFVPLEIIETPEDFVGEIRTMALPTAGSVSRIRHSRAHVRRTERGVRQSDDNSLYMSLNLGSTMQVGQAERWATLTPGSAAFYVSSLPYDLVMPTDTDQIVIQIERGHLPIAVTKQWRSLARAVDASTGRMKVLATLAERLVDSTEGYLVATRHHLGQAVIELTAWALADTSDKSPGRGLSRESLFEGMMSFIRAFGSSGTLTPEQIARAFHVSPRLMFAVFAENGKSSAREIRRQRLRAASILLSHAGVTLAEARRRTGFNDASTFSRAFTSEFGVAPSEWGSFLADNDKSNR